MRKIILFAILGMLAGQAWANVLKYDYTQTGLKVSIIKQVLAGDRVEIDYRGEKLFLDNCKPSNKTIKIACSGNFYGPDVEGVACDESLTGVWYVDECRREVSLKEKIFAGRRDIFYHDQFSNMEEGKYLMDCTWNDAGRPTYVGNYYLNCIHHKL